MPKEKRRKAKVGRERRRAPSQLPWDHTSTKGFREKQEESVKGSMAGWEEHQARSQKTSVLVPPMLLFGSHDHSELFS